MAAKSITQKYGKTNDFKIKTIYNWFFLRKSAVKNPMLLGLSNLGNM